MPGFLPFLPRAVALAAWLALAGSAPALATDAAQAQQEAQALEAGRALLALAQAPAQGDLPAMRTRGTIRVLVNWSRTSFAIENGQPRGPAYELMNGFGEWLNAREGRDDHRAPKLRLLFVPVHFNEMLPRLLAGHGDIAAASLTVSDAQARLVAFSRPLVINVAEVIVAHRGTPPLAQLEDLAGKRLMVEAGTAEHDAALALSARLVAAGLPAIDVQVAPAALEVDDLLEMVNSGAVPYLAADSHVALLWARVLPNIVVHRDLELAAQRSVAAALRPESTELRAAFDAYLAEHGDRSHASAAENFARAFTDASPLRNPNHPPVLRNAQELAPHFRHHSDQVGVAWLLMLAQGFQESGLNPEARNPSGAVGVMQVLPTTGRELGFPDVHAAEPNIAAGIRYMDKLRRTYFNDAAISPENQVFFALAGYNAGPNRIVRLRHRAAEQGLDPNVWFGNVERIVLQAVGQETVRYVGNIYRYFVMFSASPELTGPELAARQR